MSPLRTLLKSALALSLALPAFAQEEAAGERRAASLKVSPEEITLTAGDTAQFEVQVLDEAGVEIEDAEVLYLPLYGQYWNLEKRTWGFNIFKVSREGEVSTRRPGEFAVMVRVVGSAPDPSARDSEADGYVEQRVPLTILPRPVATLELSLETPVYSGSEVVVRAEPRDETGELVEGVTVRWSSSEPTIAFPVGRPATIERTAARGLLRLLSAGEVTITGTTADASAEIGLTVLESPVAGMELVPDRTSVRTGDVVHLAVSMADAGGALVEGVPVGFSVSAITDARGMGGPSSRR